jgi:hypothetical protein
MAKSPREPDDRAPGMLDDGTLNRVNEGDPPFQPEIVDELGRPVKRERGTPKDDAEEN